MLQEENEFILVIFAICGVISFIFLLFFASIINNSRLRKAKEVEKLHAVLHSIDLERDRIADDLHDEIGPMLSAIKLRAGSLHPIDTKSEEADNLKQINSLIDEVISSIRGTVKQLSSTTLQKLGIIGALTIYKGAIEQSGKIKYHFSHDPLPENWKNQSESNLYKILSELINNSIRHSNCTEIRLSLRIKKEMLVVQYSDNGSKNVQPQGIGMGLKNIDQRISLMRGEIEAANDFSKGARYSITFPLNELFSLSAIRP